MPVLHMIFWFCISSQQECEKLRATAETLQSEISEIPQKLWRLSEKCEKLNEENNDIIVRHLNSTYSLSFALILPHL